MRGWFVTGTDTGVGKTWIACALVRALRARAARVGVFKPVASGSEVTAAGLRNGDALALADAAGLADSMLDAQAYARVNPYCFQPPIAPHIAAEQVGAHIDIAALVALAEVHAAQNDCLVVEGAGGWRVPLSRDQELADLAVALGLPIVLVVGLRVGCINHALLTSAAIVTAGLPLAGWVANAVDPSMTHIDENLASLTAALGTPPLMRVPHAPDSTVLEALANAAIDRLSATHSAVLAR